MSKDNKKPMSNFAVAMLYLFGATFAVALAFILAEILWRAL